MVFLWREVLEKKVTRQVLEKSVVEKCWRRKKECGVEKCWRRVLYGSVGEMRCREVLEKSVVEKCSREVL